MRLERARGRRFGRTARARRTPALAAAALAVAIGLGAAPARADFEDGVAAYQVGDFARALEIWRPLAEAGDAAAQFNLGIMYRQGEGVSRDYAAARRWFASAARRGNGLAMFNLGLMAGSGQGQETDLVEARRWMLLAGAASEPDSRLASDATYLGDLLREQLDEPERARSVRRARDWAAANPEAVDLAVLPEPAAEPEPEPEPRLAPMSGDAASIVLNSALPEAEAADPESEGAAEPEAEAAPAARSDDGQAPAPSNAPETAVTAPEAATAPPAETPTAETATDAAPDDQVATAAPPAAPAALASAHRVQLASLDSADAARAAWESFRQRHSELLGDLSLYVEEATIDGRQFYRVQAGPLDAAGADGLCRRLRERGQDCLFVAP
ncbi:MAG: SPOR domain-containing protein [Azospirillaceae bacterium]